MNVRIAASLILTLCTALCACSGKNAQDARTAAAGRVPPGLYRRENDPTVYNLHGDGSYCIVISPEQMAAFGGFALVKMADASAALVTGYRPIAGSPACPWPDGYYSKTGTRVVYRISGATACTLSSAAAKTLSVESVSASANLLDRKKPTGACQARYRP